MKKYQKKRQYTMIKWRHTTKIIKFHSALSFVTTTDNSLSDAVASLLWSAKDVIGTSGVEHHVYCVNSLYMLKHYCPILLDNSTWSAYRGEGSEKTPQAKINSTNKSWVRDAMVFVATSVSNPGGDGSKDMNFDTNLFNMWCNKKDQVKRYP